MGIRRLPVVIEQRRSKYGAVRFCSFDALLLALLSFYRRKKD
jgi:hypothetical protein